MYGKFYALTTGYLVGVTFVRINYKIVFICSIMEEMLHLKENRKGGPNQRTAPSLFVAFVGIRPWVTTLMPSPVNLVRHSSEEMP